MIQRYLEIIEDRAASKFEATNRRNALQRVFPFYKSKQDDYILHLNAEDVSFLVDILRLEEKADSIEKAILIGALTAACSYFVHLGHPLGFHLIMEKLLTIPEIPGENRNLITYRHFTEADLDRLKREDPFLYYHLTCRIPNQYLVCLFDLFLIETDPLLQRTYEGTITTGLQYLKRQIKELSLMPEVLLWEFKRDQEIGAVAGTIGQLTLYMRAYLKGDDHAFAEAEKCLQIAVEYVHPLEKNRDENYLILCRLARIIRQFSYWENSRQEKSLEKEKTEISGELNELALILGKRFINAHSADPFDVMFSTNIVAVANVIVSSDLAESLYVQMGFPWEKLSRIMGGAPHQYAAFLLVTYLLLAPRKLIDRIPDFELLVQKALAYFKLNDLSRPPENMMDLIALKLILAHAWYVSTHGAENDRRRLESYKSRIENAPMYARWAPECVAFLNECLSQTGFPFRALQLIYAVPY
jgi:hypothetical protein